MKCVDIILPNYNSSSTISATIKSILNQTYKNWKLIIIDDGSDKKTLNILSKYEKIKKIKIFYLKKNKGVSYCRNFAIKKTTSHYIAFIDSDDLWKKNKLHLQIKFMQKNNYNFTYTHYNTFNNKNNFKKIVRTPSKFDFDSFTKNTSIATSTMIVKRATAKKLKFLNTKICEDYYYKCQLLKRIGFAYCYPSCLTQYQIRENSLQSNRFRNLYWVWRINKNQNQFNTFENFISIFLISFNSIKKYGLR
jgi:teichuronic acid biosynthesis glycosyltransferase TuaG